MLAHRPTSLPSLRECKIRASLLLKAVRSDDMARSTLGAERFRVLKPFAPLEANRIVAWRESLRRKHALAVIAIELGYASWSALREACDAALVVPSLDWLFDPHGAVYLNHWCTTYEEAAEIHQRVGGFLVPYRHQFAVCEPGLLASRGLDPYDPDWALIGHDRVRPRDRDAFARLVRRMIDSGLAAA